MNRILIIEDEAHLAEGLRFNLEAEGYSADIGDTGENALEVLTAPDHGFDLLILDVMLPGIDGFDVMSQLRANRQLIPTLMLTARSRPDDVLRGFEAGADDYLTKPFDPRELVARIKSVLRRAEMLPPRHVHAGGRLKFDRWRFDLARAELISDSEVTIRLSTGEHALLVTFVEHAGITLSREQLLDLTRGRDAQLFDRSIDNQISRLRRKLEVDPKNPRIILTKWGGGYVFAAELEWT